MRMGTEPETTMSRYAAGGAALPTVRRDITQDGINAYCKASGDNNRIHHDAKFAASTRFGGVIAHGMLTLALVSEMMTSAYGAEWLATGSLRVRFRGAARPGDVLETVGTVAKLETGSDGVAITCNVELRNADSGERIITGSASLMIREITLEGCGQ